MQAKRKKTDEQIVAILSEHAGGVTAKEIIRRHGIGLDTFYRWKRQFSGMTKGELQRLKALEDENRRLKRMVADQALNIQVLKDALGKEW
jgi:putative transposase